MYCSGADHTTFDAFFIECRKYMEEEEGLPPDERRRQSLQPRPRRRSRPSWQFVRPRRRRRSRPSWQPRLRPRQRRMPVQQSKLARSVLATVAHLVGRESAHRVITISSHIVQKLYSNCTVQKLYSNFRLLQYSTSTFFLTQHCTIFCCASVLTVPLNVVNLLQCTYCSALPLLSCPEVLSRSTVLL